MAHAQELISNHPDSYFIASVDLQLPDGENGAALELVNQYDPPTIAYTGQEDPSIREGFNKHNFIDYVYKKKFTQHLLNKLAMPQSLAQHGLKGVSGG